MFNNSALNNMNPPSLENLQDLTNPWIINNPIYWNAFAPVKLFLLYVRDFHKIGKNRYFMPQTFDYLISSQSKPHEWIERE